MAITNSTISSDQEKFLASKLIARSMLTLVSNSICDKVQQPDGTGTTAYFVRYERMNVPLATLTEGVEPTESSFTLSQVTVTLDQWGDLIYLTDIAQLTAKHDSLRQAIDLLADNAARVIDRETQLVWLAGTNIIYGDGSVTSRATVTTSMVVDQTLIQKARVTLIDQGAPPKNGPSGQDMYKVKSAMSSASINQGQAFVAVCGPQVMADIQAISTSLGTWASVAMYANQKALYNSEVGTWLNIRWVETNFIPKFNALGSSTAAVASGNAFGTNTPVVTAVNGGGSLLSATTYYFKVTRKNKLRGFEEDISFQHTMTSAATGDNESYSFNFSSLAAGYVYNVYFGATTGDANLLQAFSNVEVGATVIVTAVPISTVTAPPNVDATGTPTIHPVYIHGAESTSWVGLQELQTFITPNQSVVGNVLQLKRGVGYKFMSKAMIRDQLRLLRLEVASNFA